MAAAMTMHARRRTGGRIIFIQCTVSDRRKQKQGAAKDVVNLQEPGRTMNKILEAAARASDVWRWRESELIYCVSRCSALYVDQPTFSGRAGFRAGNCN